MQLRFNHARLVFILILYIIMGIIYSLLVPLGESVDEVDHYDYIAYVGRFRELPVMKPSLRQNVTYEAHQPPLYYLVNAVLAGGPATMADGILPVNPCFSWNPEDVQRHNMFIHSTNEKLFGRTELVYFRILRWFSILMGAATVVAAYSIAYVLSDGNVQLGALTAAILAFNPQFIHITSSVNNDVLAALLGTTVTLMSIIVAKSSSQTRHCILLGLLVGLCLLTKLSLIIFWPLALLATGMTTVTKLKSNNSTPSAVRQGNKNRYKYWAILSCLAPVLFIPVVVAGWWYLRSFNLYGDPLAWHVMLTAKGSYIGRYTPFSLTDLLQFIVLHFESYWLRFGWFNVTPPSWFYSTFALFVGFSLVGFVTRRKTLRRMSEPIWIIASLPVFLTYLALFIYLQDVNWTGYQGRLAFGAAASVALILAKGFLSLPTPKIGYVFAITLFFLAILAIPLMILPSYYGENEALSKTTDMCGRFENGLQLDSFQTEGVIAPGENISVRLQGYGLASAYEPQTVSVRLVDEIGREITASSLPVSWAQGEKVTMQLELALPQNARPGPAHVEVNMLSAEGLRIPSLDVRGQELSPPTLHIFIQPGESTH